MSLVPRAKENLAAAERFLANARVCGTDADIEWALRHLEECAQIVIEVETSETEHTKAMRSYDLERAMRELRDATPYGGTH